MSAVSEQYEHRPKVSVLMPVYNGEHYLNQAVDSILHQSFTDFEFLIINDGSTDRTVDILHSYRDPRIRILHNDRNLGLIETLNKGLAFARGVFIARMDCDDISLPERLAEQVTVMESTPEIGVCGTWARLIDERGEFAGILKMPAGRELQSLYWRPSPFIHPTCMIRASLVKEEHYNPQFKHAEDYELWMRLSRKTGFYNIPRYLFLYRVHGANVTISHREEQLRLSYRIFMDYFNLPQIGYDRFLSLIFVARDLDPIRRAYCHWLISSRTKIHLPSFIKDNLRYCSGWLKACVS